MSESFLSTKQQIALELTKTLIAQGDIDPANKAIAYADIILGKGEPVSTSTQQQSRSMLIGFVANC
jgi:hypothetical protein